MIAASRGRVRRANLVLRQRWRQHGFGSHAVATRSRAMTAVELLFRCEAPPVGRLGLGQCGGNWRSSKVISAASQRQVSSFSHAADAHERGCCSSYVSFEMLRDCFAVEFFTLDVLLRCTTHARCCIGCPCEGRVPEVERHALEPRRRLNAGPSSIGRRDSACCSLCASAGPAVAARCRAPSRMAAYGALIRSSTWWPATDKVQARHSSCSERGVRALLSQHLSIRLLMRHAGRCAYTLMGVGGTGAARAATLVEQTGV